MLSKKASLPLGHCRTSQLSALHEYNFHPKFAYYLTVDSSGTCCKLLASKAKKSVGACLSASDCTSLRGSLGGAGNLFSLNFRHCFRYGSDAARMWLGCGSDASQSSSGGAPEGATTLLHFSSTPEPLFKASKAPCLTLRVATPSGAPRQAPLECGADVARMWLGRGSDVARTCFRMRCR